MRVCVCVRLPTYADYPIHILSRTKLREWSGNGYPMRQICRRESSTRRGSSLKRSRRCVCVRACVCACVCVCTCVSYFPMLPLALLKNTGHIMPLTSQIRTLRQEVAQQNREAMVRDVDMDTLALTKVCIHFPSLSNLDLPTSSRFCLCRCPFSQFVAFSGLLLMACSP
jgi:hypothetical protein